MLVLVTGATGLLSGALLPHLYDVMDVRGLVKRAVRLTLTIPRAVFRAIRRWGQAPADAQQGAMR